LDRGNCTRWHWILWPWFCWMLPLVFPPYKWYILLCEFCYGCHDFHTIRDVILDEVDGSKESPDLFEVVRARNLEDCFNLLLSRAMSCLCE
jgi:hypothetical protein